jgi:hypothetical protein
VFQVPTTYTASLTSLVADSSTKPSSWSAWYSATASVAAMMRVVACPVLFRPVTEKRLRACLLDCTSSFCSTKALPLPRLLGELRL